MSDNGSDDAHRKEIQFKVVWRTKDADDLQSLHANQLLIGQTPFEYYLIFGESGIPIPMFAGQDDLSPEQERELPIKPLVKIAVPPAAMKNMVKLLVKTCGSMLDEGDGEPQ